MFAIKDYLFPLVTKLMSAKGVPTSMGPTLWYYNIYIIKTYDKKQVGGIDTKSKCLIIR